ncbi:MAG: hypothetical protein ACLPX1_06035 [Steroidobacteraceae bacterium]
MSTRQFLTAAILGSSLMMAGSAFAVSHGAGGGHASGGHASGGHTSGGHTGGFGHAAYGGGYSRGGVAAHAYAGSAYGGGMRGYGAAGGGYHSQSYGRNSGYVGYHGGYAGYHGGYGGYHGYSTGAYWGGGYWHGGYWPRAYYGYGFSWFLPLLPIGYATYWYGGIPYYYANDVYYTWNPDYQGYTATDPPPVADPSGAAAEVAPATGGPGAGAQGTAGQIFMYPMNGQSPEQQSIDRQQCQQWAAQQTGQGAASGSDYQRAVMACIEGRGYSAQ